MKKKTLSAFSIIAILLVAAVLYQQRSTDDNMPYPDPSLDYNVILLVADAMRPDVLSCYGGEAQTPNIDWLADNGALFENAYSTSPWTAPSAVSIFTGNYATSYGYAPFMGSMQIHVPESERLFADVLQDSGYITKKWIENVQATMHGCLRGFKALTEIDPQANPVAAQMSDSICRITGGEFFDNPGYKSSFNLLLFLLGVRPADKFYLHHWIIDPHEPYRPERKFESRIAVQGDKLIKH
ncbi:MAG: sulfatase-like hydrolase/transferase, partial [Candidatus Latescibacterota bacterium]